MVTRRKFSREFKAEAVKLVKGRGVSVAQAARDLDIHENVLRKWIRELADDAARSGAGVLRADLAEIARLKKENAKLRMERDLLKKAALSSTRRCNTGRKFKARSDVAQGLTGPGVQFQGDGIKLFLSERRQVSAFREILAQQAVRVFVRAPLPWTPRVTEIDL